MATRLNRIIRAVGKIQLGFRTISSKVALGEKNTPKIRPIGEIAACGSATGGGMVAIEDSSTTVLSRIASESTTRDPLEKYHTSPTRGISGTAVGNSLVSIIVGTILAIARKKE
jgi:hypothetical protein